MLIDGSEIGIRKGVKVAVVNIPEPACRLCRKAITDNLFTTMVIEGCPEGTTTIAFVCEGCREDE